MVSRQRVRRAAFLCIHALSNVACFRAGCDVDRSQLHRHFYGRAHNNFLDVAVIKWCEIFADRRARHYSFAIVSDRDRFSVELWKHLGLTKEQFDLYCKQLRQVRNKFIAHLDDDVSASMPMLDVAVESAKFLLMYLVQHENRNGELEGVSPLGQPYYDSAYHDAYLAYGGEPKTYYTGGQNHSHD